MQVPERGLMVTEVQFRLLFEAGRVAEERGWSDAQLVSADALQDQSPVGPPIVIALRSTEVSAQIAKTVSALAGAGRRALVVTDQPLPADVTSWLPADSWVVAMAQTVPTVVAASADHRHELQVRMLKSLLTDSEADDVRKYLAGNQNTPQRILADLATGHNGGRWTAYLAGNPSAPLEFLDQILDRDDHELPESLARNTALPLPKRHDVMRRVARSSVEGWVEDEGSFDNDFADLNVMTDVPRDVFEVFREAGYLFGEWIYSESIPEDLLLQIFNEGETEPYQRRGFASRSSTPDSVLRALAASENWGLREFAAAPSDAPVDVLTSLAADESEWVRMRVAENPNTPVDALIRLLNDADGTVRTSAAMNPSLPVHLAESRLADIAAIPAVDGWVECIELGRASPVALAVLGAHHDARIRSAVAACPTTPAETLSLLASDDDALVRLSVAENNAAPASLRTEVLRSDMAANGGSISNSYRARSTASQEDCPAEVLGVLARDSDPEVRAAVIVNPATPLGVLEAMAADREIVE